MALFVLCVNLMVAGFLFITAAEVVTLLIGGVIWAVRRKGR